MTAQASHDPHWPALLTSALLEIGVRRLTLWRTDFARFRRQM